MTVYNLTISFTNQSTIPNFAFSNLCLILINRYASQLSFTGKIIVKERIIILVTRPYIFFCFMVIWPHLERRTLFSHLVFYCYNKNIKVIWKGRVLLKFSCPEQSSSWREVKSVTQVRNWCEDNGGCCLLANSPWLVFLYISGHWNQWTEPSHINHYPQNAPQPCLQANLT